jgi:hypothetical protein
VTNEQLVATSSPAPSILFAGGWRIGYGDCRRLTHSAEQSSILLPLIIRSLNIIIMADDHRLPPGPPHSAWYDELQTQNAHNGTPADTTELEATPETAKNDINNATTALQPVPAVPINGKKKKNPKKTSLQGRAAYRRSGQWTVSTYDAL